MKACKLFVVYFIILFCGASKEGFSQKRIAVIGSSSAYGYFPVSSGYPRDSAWTFMIKKHFKDLAIIDTLFNLAQISTDCFEGMPSSYVPPAGFNYRMPNPAINITRAVRLLPKPDVIIVNYPSNNYDWIPNEMVINCLRTIRDSANGSGIRCFVTTTQPRDGFSPNERLKLKTLRDLILAEFGEFAIDFFTDIVQEPALTIQTVYSIGDGVHLNPAGHRALKAKVLEKNLFFAVVPVSLGELKATTQNDHILLQWKSYNETGTDRFVVETSTDGLLFSALATLPGSLNPTSTKFYNYSVMQPVEGQNYYRIVSVSAQNQQLYSNTAAARFVSKKQVSVAVTFTNTLVNLDFKEALQSQVTAVIYDMQGKQVSKTLLQPGAALSQKINIEFLGVGKYVLQLLLPDRRESFPIIKL